MTAYLEYQTTHATHDEDASPEVVTPTNREGDTSTESWVLLFVTSVNVRRDEPGVPVRGIRTSWTWGRFPQ